MFSLIKSKQKPHPVTGRIYMVRKQINIIWVGCNTKRNRTAKIQVKSKCLELEQEENQEPIIPLEFGKSYVVNKNLNLYRIVSYRSGPSFSSRALLTMPLLVLAIYRNRTS
ncbi:hypothetical protein V6N13_009247 [Hibiscus sabdariffa]